MSVSTSGRHGLGVLMAGDRYIQWLAGRISYKNANSNIGGVIRFLINSYHGAVGLDPRMQGL